MKLGEIILMNMVPLKLLAEHGVVMFNTRDIDLYQDYCILTDKGEKTTYIYCLLAERYSVSERQVRRIISNFNKEATNTGMKYL